MKTEEERLTIFEEKKQKVSVSRNASQCKIELQRPKTVSEMTFASQFRTDFCDASHLSTLNFSKFEQLHGQESEFDQFSHRDNACGVFLKQEPFDTVDDQPLDQSMVVVGKKNMHSRKKSSTQPIAAIQQNMEDTTIISQERFLDPESYPDTTDKKSVPNLKLTMRGNSISSND